MKTLIRILMLLAVIQLQAQEDENASASNNDNTVIAEEVNRQDKVVETALGIKKLQLSIVDKFLQQAC